MEQMGNFGCRSARLEPFLDFGIDTLTGQPLIRNAGILAIGGVAYLGRILIAFQQDSVEGHPVLHEILDRQGRNSVRRAPQKSDDGAAKTAGRKDMFDRMMHMASRGHGTQNDRECDPAVVTRITARQFASCR